jgi:hypothetical protein
MIFSRQPECTLSKYGLFAWVNCTYVLISSSSMWSQFCKKYKQGSTELPIEGDDETAEIAAMPDMSSYVAKQSTIAANAFLSASHKKGCLQPVSNGGGSSSESSPTSSDMRSNSASHRTPRREKKERSALSVLDVLLGRD